MSDILPFQQYLVSHVESRLRRVALPGDRLLVAVSGGFDSVGLLGLLMASPTVDRSRIVVAHCDHGLREDSINDRKFVLKLADSWGVRSVVRSGNLRSWTGRTKGSVEAVARQWRYRALEDMADEAGCRLILTGHTMEDSAETVLWRMRSGAPWYEWSAIPDFRGRIYRPLLSVHREDVRNWAIRRGLAGIEDPTNLDARFQRNRIRQALSEVPEFWNRRTVRRLSDAGADLGLWYKNYRRLARIFLVLNGWNPATGEQGLAIEEISRYFNCLRFVPVEVAWATLAGRPDARLSSDCRSRILKVLAGRGPKADLVLPEDVSLARRGQKFWIFRSRPAQVERTLRLGRSRIPELPATVCLRVAAREKASSRALTLRPTLVDDGLVLRGWKAGDRIKLRGRPEKKVADLFAELKLSPQQRHDTMVLADHLGPVAVLGRWVAERALPRLNDDQVLIVECATNEQNP